MSMEKKTIRRQLDHATSTSTMAVVNHLVENARIPLVNDDHQGYECKTCQKRFSTYQALGGHQGIHKKVKPEEDVNDESWLSLNILGSSSKSSGLHSCKVCTKGFPTGQALGGHMRCHRPELEGVVLMETDHEQEEEKADSDLTIVEREPLQRHVGEEDDRYSGKRDLMLGASEWKLSI